MAKRALKVSIKYVAYALIVGLVASYLYWSWNKSGVALVSEFFSEGHSLFKHDPDAEVLENQVVQIIPKDFALDHLDVPKSIARDNSKQILTAVEVPGGEAITVFDTSDGSSDTLVRKAKPPFFTFLNSNELGIRYGLGTENGRAGAIYYKRDIARVGNIYLGTYADVNEKGQATVTASLSLKW